MHRFLLRENVKRLRALLSRATGDCDRAHLENLLSESEGELLAASEIWRLTCPQFPIRPELGGYAEDLLEDLVREQKADYGSLQIFDEQQNALFLMAPMHFSAPFVREFAVVRTGGGSVCNKAAIRREIVHVVDVQADPEFAVLRPFATRYGIHAIQSTPILSPSGKLWGVFSTHFRERRRYCDADRQACAKYQLQLRAVIGACLGY